MHQEGKIQKDPGQNDGHRMHITRSPGTSSSFILHLHLPQRDMEAEEQQRRSHFPGHRAESDMGNIMASGLIAEMEDHNTKAF